jgi:hypothetical protein
MLVAAKAAAPEPMAYLREAARSTTLSQAGVRICRYDVASGGSGRMVEPVPTAGCKPPSDDWVGRDFMTGGSARLAGQATQDISAAFVGGYVFGSVFVDLEGARTSGCLCTCQR